jgi:flagellar hook-basal body complex protein FliE
MSTECQGTTQKQRQTTSQMEQLSLSTSNLHDVISKLHDNLSNISQAPQPTDPSSTTVKCEEPEVLCDIANSIRESNLSVNRAIRRINEIINCLEN